MWVCSVRYLNIFAQQVNMKKRLLLLGGLVWAGTMMYGQSLPLEMRVSANYGAIASGDGDAVGFAATFGLAKFFSSRFALVPEYRFAEGTRIAKTFYSSFSQKNMNYISAQASYFPFGYYRTTLTGLAGIHLDIGPSFLFGTNGYEDRWESIVVNGVETSRTSHLVVNRMTSIGYAITVGYLYKINNYSIGARMDYSNFKETEGYVMVGVVFGVTLPTGLKFRSGKR